MTPDVTDDGNERYRVTVEFTHNLGEYESPEQFVEQCLNGNRSNAFAWDIDIVDSDTSHSNATQQ